MSTDAQYQIVTANRLMDGDVVFLTANHRWDQSLNQAAIAASPDEAAHLLAIAEPQEHAVVGPYLIDVAVDVDGRPLPTHYRERIRVLGPTNRLDLGRQADGLQEASHVSV